VFFMGILSKIFKKDPFKEIEKLHSAFESHKYVLPTYWYWHRDALHALEEMERKLIMDVREIEKMSAEALSKDPRVKTFLKVSVQLNAYIAALGRELQVLETLLSQGKTLPKEYQLKETEKINSILGKIGKLLGIISLEKKQGEYGSLHTSEISEAERKKRIAQLKEWKFPVEKELQLTEFLIKHWDGTNEMAKTAGWQAGNLFYGLSVVKDLINEKTWPMVVEGFSEMAKATGDHAGSLFRYGLPAVKDLINEKTWPMFVKGFFEMEEAAGKNAEDLFHYGLPAVKDLINEKTWPGMVEMAKAAGEEAGWLFRYGLPGVKDLINEKTWPGMVEMAKAAGEEAEKLFGYGLRFPDVNDLIMNKPWIWPGMVEMAKAAGKNAGLLFRYGLPAVHDLINEKTFPVIKKYFLELLKYCKGTEQELFDAFEDLKPLFKVCGIELFDLLLIPTAKSQTVGTSLCFQSFGRITEAIKTKEDLEILRFIVEKKLRKANDILKNIIIKGLKKGIIKDLTQEKGVLKEFLTQTPAYLIELYEEFKNIYLGPSAEKKKHSDYENLFSDVEKLKEDIVNGSLTKEYDENIVLGVLFSIFAPEVSTDRDRYKRILDSRTDRQSDIPSALNRLSGREVSISKGGYILKGELDTSSWNNLIEAVNEINRNRIKVVPEQVGLNLLREYKEKTLRENQKEYLKQIYDFDVGNGNALPDFNTNHETLMKYKEFIGDRLKNDLIFTLLSKAQEKSPAEFAEQLGKTKADYSTLAKFLLDSWKYNKPNKEKIIKSILESKGFFVESIDWPADITAAQINDRLNSLPAVIEKSLVQKIFNALYGEQYKGMEKEMEKFEFKREVKTLVGKHFRFILSKRKMHSIAMFNMGICVAPDNELWESKDFWQMIIFDEENDANGGVIYRTIEEDGKKYLIASIQPSTSILSSVSPQQTYAKIIQFSRLMVKTLKYQNLLIPTISAIHSNRGSIKAIITSKDYPKITLKHVYNFSYSPHDYTYQEFFIVA